VVVTPATGALVAATPAHRPFTAAVAALFVDVGAVVSIVMAGVGVVRVAVVAAVTCKIRRLNRLNLLIKRYCPQRAFIGSMFGSCCAGKSTSVGSTSWPFLPADMAALRRHRPS
jgi:hypothetical protein